MSRLTIGTEPVQVARYNPKRLSLSVQYLPGSQIAGNVGNVFGAYNGAPKADLTSNTWDFALNPGASDGTNISETLPEAHQKGDLWLVSDTADQIINVVETNIPEIK